MKRLLDAMMERRARKLALRLRPHLPTTGRVLDIGTGTGHPARAIADTTGLTVTGADVVDLGVATSAPVLFDGTALPFPDDAFDAALLIHVLQYPIAPVDLLREAARVARGAVLVLQTTRQGAAAKAVLDLNELLWGPAAFRVARAVGYVRHDAAFSLGARCTWTRARLEETFAAAGMLQRSMHPRPWPALALSYDLYVLQRRR